MELKKIKLLIFAERIYITLNSLELLATPNIYFYNTFYYFPSVSKDNTFKLVKKGMNQIKVQYLPHNQVFLVNVNELYLQRLYICRKF